MMIDVFGTVWTGAFGDVWLVEVAAIGPCRITDACTFQAGAVDFCVYQAGADDVCVHQAGAVDFGVQA